MARLNETHDPALESWVESANGADVDFPIQNLPFGVFSHPDTGRATVGIAIGDQILDVTAAYGKGVLDGPADDAARACGAENLNPLMALGGRDWSALRAAVSRALRSDGEVGEAAQAAQDDILVPMPGPGSGTRMLMPAAIGDYTDFYASIYHATNVGRMMRPDNPLMPNYKHIPIAYHGRASSIVVSGEPCRRPFGQTKPADAESPSFGPTKAFDYETEMAFYVGPGNPLGQPVSLTEAEDHIFGLSILNDWSARDIQAWEYQPLGPFLAKSFSSHVSPWVVPLEALAPFRCAAYQRPDGDPAPLDYLASDANEAQGGFDVRIQVSIASQQMRKDGMEPVTLAVTNMQHLYWTIFQMLTHHTSNGCNLRPGDMMGTGTISGPTDESLGSILEIAKRGAAPVSLPTGEERSFLADGDELIMRAWCEADGARSIGLGECRGVIEGV
ncbi:MAG: fumarylacetoacetase [Rhodospirillales bacterium]|nr:fumarylacetoacetase [Rhodospirillales bacterium]